MSHSDIGLRFGLWDSTVSFDCILFHFPPKGARVDTRHSSGFGYVATIAVQCFLKVGFLKPFFDHGAGHFEWNFRIDGIREGFPTGRRSDIVGKYDRIDDIIIGDDKGPFENVFQLSDVSGPIILHQAAHDLSRNLSHIFVKFAIEDVDKVIDQKGDVVNSLAQGRYMDGDHIEPVIEFHSKFAPVDFFLDTSDWWPR